MSLPFNSANHFLGQTGITPSYRLVAAAGVINVAKARPIGHSTSQRTDPYSDKHVQVPHQLSLFMQRQNAAGPKIISIIGDQQCK